jgi:hypothetical protein
MPDTEEYHSEHVERMDDKTLPPKKAPHYYKDVWKAERRWTYQRRISKRVQKADSIVSDGVKKHRVSHINCHT